MLTLLRNWLARRALKQSRRVTARILHGLDDHILCDIGVSRSEIDCLFQICVDECSRP